MEEREMVGFSSMTPMNRSFRCHTRSNPRGCFIAFLLMLVLAVLAKTSSLDARAQDAPHREMPPSRIDGEPAFRDAVVPTPDIQRMILDIVAGMPKGGAYRANSEALAKLKRAIQRSGSSLAIDAADAVPSFCSSATYLVFVSLIRDLVEQRKLTLDETTAAALLVQKRQGDGVGAWGRWNANGPGTARFFFETGVGRNFADLNEAEPGDFLKIFWTEEIGAHELGHSVIYLGRRRGQQGDLIRYWSSNKHGGYGIAEVPAYRICRMLFSHFENPTAISRIALLPARDDFLAGMLHHSCKEAEMAAMVGITLDAPPAEGAQRRRK